MGTLTDEEAIREKIRKCSALTPVQEYLAHRAEPEERGVRSYHVGASDYSRKKIQPWDIWLEYDLNPWDADIVKRVLRTKEGTDPCEEYEKIKHLCDERIRQLRCESVVVTPNQKENTP